MQTLHFVGAVEDGDVGLEWIQHVLLDICERCGCVFGQVGLETRLGPGWVAGINGAVETGVAKIFAPVRVHVGE